MKLKANIEEEEAIKSYIRYIKNGSKSTLYTFKFHMLNLRLLGEKDRFYKIYKIIEDKEILLDERFRNLIDVITE